MELISLGLPATFQFDVRADGTLAPTANLTVSFERLGHLASTPVSPDGEVARVLGIFGRLGLADRRAELLAGACMACRVPARDRCGVRREVALVCLPACAKLKCESGQLTQAKWYQVIRAMPL